MITLLRRDVTTHDGAHAGKRDDAKRGMKTTLYIDEEL